ncbi:hypothetical protein VNI00_013421 [Paramarasmius palmivorus]|uniref:Uncharacterized protein n=1 Tax=Paramarasmius palmivorus TaxID=297713 RepID=A0AAW0BZ75_9AGAR
MARAMLDRSKGAPLTLHFRDFPQVRFLEQSWAVILEAFANHLSHITSIDMSFNDFQARQLLSVMTQPAPLLTHLALDRTDKSGAPLKSIHLTGVNLPLESPLYQNVTHLTLRTATPEFQHLYSTRQWIRLLRDMSGLKRLHLEDVLPHPDSAVPELKDPVHLAHLEYVYFSSTIPQITNFLRYIALPYHTEVRLCNCRFAATTSVGRVDELALLRPVLAEIVGTKQGPTGSLRLSNKNQCSCCDSELLSFEVLTSSTTESEHDHSQYLTGHHYYQHVRPRLYLELALREEVDLDIDTLIREVSRSFSLGHLHTLGLEIQDEYISVETLREFFGSLPRLKDLTITENMIYTFVQLIIFSTHIWNSGSGQDSNEPGQSGPKFALPETLRIHDTDFTDFRSSTQWRILTLMPRLYQDPELPLPKFIFSQCILYGQQVTYLRENSMVLEEGCRVVEADEARWEEYNEEVDWSILFGEDVEQI